ncbi:entry exclusion protein TrbK [Agrobacterium sp. V1]|uniref:entry exclusion protein TrbK n=1 Tax=Agrobacterium sp. V1 TaxID=3061957 RepID=UPI0034A0016A
MKPKLIITLVAALLSLGGTGLWFITSERRAAQERREKFFGSTRDYPAAGGEKMKIEW